MKYIKSYKLLEESSFGEIYIDLIADILLPIKDDYNGIEGDIKTLKNGDVVIEINVNKIKFKGDKYTIERMEDIQSFLSLIVEATKRIKEATNKEVRILNIYDTLSLNEEALLITDPIKIFIMSGESFLDNH